MTHTFVTTTELNRITVSTKHSVCLEILSGLSIAKVDIAVPTNFSFRCSHVKIMLVTTLTADLHKDNIAYSIILS